MREVLVAVGIGLALNSIPVMICASFAIASVDRSEATFNEAAEWSWGLDSYLDGEFD